MPERFVSRLTGAVGRLTRIQPDVGLAVAVGFVTGLLVAILERVIGEGLSEKVLRLPLWAEMLAPTIGLSVSAALLRAGGHLGSATSDAYIANYHDPSDLPARPFPWRIMASIATLGSGAPGGLEGPSMYLGSVLGSSIQSRFRRFFDFRQSKALMVAGAAAGVAATFKAPATGAVFALEVPYRDDLGRHMLVPALLGGASGYLGLVLLNGTSPIFNGAGPAPLDRQEILGAIALGVIVGIFARGFASLLRRSKSWGERVPAWKAVLVGGVLIGAAVGLAELFVGEGGGTLALTPGYNVIEWATNPIHSAGLVAVLLVLRIVGVCATFAGRGVAGVFVPLVVTGALSGRLVASIVHADNVGLFIVIGVAAALGAGYRVPLASVMFVAEATGRAGFVVPGLLASVVADLMMGNMSVTRYQESSRSVDEYH